MPDERNDTEKRSYNMQWKKKKNKQIYFLFKNKNVFMRRYKNVRKRRFRDVICNVLD